MQDIAIRVTNIHKSFKVYPDKSNTLKERVLFRSRNRYEKNYVLNGVTVEIPRGICVGLIGENGSGKSTFLKLLTRIMIPDQGQIEMYGRVSSLLELGAGFHMDMSGRENIYTNASIFGLTRKEIDARIDDIIAFAEIGDAIDMAVRTYSSGMYMRLAFAVAIKVDADILLVDEILAVGDANFRSKCFNAMREIKRNGTTIVIVSHMLSQIEQICERTLWLDNGIIRMDGDPRQVHPQYLDYMSKKNASKHDAIVQRPQQSALVVNQGKPSDAPSNATTDDRITQKQCDDQSRSIEITRISLLDKDETPKSLFKTGEKMRVKVEYRCRNLDIQVAIGIGLIMEGGATAYGVNTRLARLPLFSPRECGNVIVEFDKNMLLPGDYFINIAFQTIDGFNLDFWKRAVKFTMYSDITETGIIRMPCTWYFDDIRVE